MVAGGLSPCIPILPLHGLVARSLPLPGSLLFLSQMRLRLPEFLSTGGRGK